MRLLAFIYIGFLTLGSKNQSTDIPLIRSNTLFVMSVNHAYQATCTFGHDLIQIPRIDQLTELIQALKSEFKDLEIQFKDTISI